MFSNYSITLALLSFFSTTVDDFCVILIFFAREYVKVIPTHHLCVCVCVVFRPTLGPPPTVLL